MAISPIWLVFLSMALSSESRLVPLALLGGFVLPLAYFTLTSLHQIHFSGGTRRRPRMVYAAWITLEIGMALLMSCMAGLAG